MAGEGGVGDVGPALDRSREAELAPALDRGAIGGRLLDQSAQTAQVLRVERCGVIDLALFGDEAGVLEVHMVVRRVSAQQERRQLIVVVNGVRIIEKGGKAAAAG